MLESVARVLSLPLGAVIVIYTLFSAIRTFVLPRSARDSLTRAIFRAVRQVFSLFTRRSTTYGQRDRIMALYAPVTLLVMPIVWLNLVAIGYMFMFWAIGVPDAVAAYKISGSSLLTLGFSNTETLAQTLLSFSEATIGLMLIALLIAYLPTMYNAFSQREAQVAMLEVRAGSPPFCVEMFLRFHRLRRWEELHEVWVEWERWFSFVEESHTSLAALNFFRSPQPDRSWITAAGAVLDSASFAASTLDIPRDVQADLCIRAGYIALRQICDFFELPYDPNPRSDDPISITRDEFLDAYGQLREAGVPVKTDVEQAWRDFAGWRVNYDVPLLSLAALMMAPYAPWSSDRSLNRMSTRMWIKQRKAQEKWQANEVAD